MQTGGPDLTNSNFTGGLVTTSLGEVFATTNRSCQDSNALGVLRSTDQGASWTQLNLGLTSTNVGSLALSKGGNLFAGSHDGVFRYDRTLATWQPSGLSGQTIIMLVATQNGLFAADSCYCRGLYQSFDEGTTWQPTLRGLPGCVNAFVQDGSGNSIAGTGTSGVFKLPAGGTSWQAVNSGLPTSNVSSLALDAGGNLFMGGPAGLFRMNQGAAQWQQLTSGLPSDGIQRIAFGSGARVFVGTFSHGIYVSSDGGSSWSEDNSGIANITPTVGAFAKDSQGFLYVSVGSIVYRSTNSQEVGGTGLAVDAGVQGGVVEDAPLRVGGAVTRPEIINQIRPIYTPLARRARVTGKVIVEAMIDIDGNVSRVRVLRGLPMGLNSAAVDAVQKWKFKPATLEGKAVKVNYVLTVNFPPK
jgi:TonB family protein